MMRPAPLSTAMSGDTIRYSTSTSSPVNVTPDNPLTALIRRLEAATSRLEDIASSTHGFEQNGNGESAPPEGGEQARGSEPEPGSTNTGGISREASTSTVKRVADPLPPRIEEMDGLISGEVKAFVDASKGLDALVEKQVGLRIEC